MLSSAAQGVLTMQELADYLHISPTTVYRLMWRRVCIVSVAPQ
jgi:DNA-binding CsgD family transcriptional regulator